MEAGQFATRYFVFYVGWTFDCIPVVWLLRRVTRSANHAAPPADGLHATTPLITDKLRSYSAACRAVMPSMLHCTDQYANNRAEVSHQPIRQRERQMRRFKSAA